MIFNDKYKYQPKKREEKPINNFRQPPQMKPYTNIQQFKPPGPQPNINRSNNAPVNLYKVNREVITPKRINEMQNINDINAERELNALLQGLESFIENDFLDMFYGTNDLKKIAKSNEVNHEK